VLVVRTQNIFFFFIKNLNSNKYEINTLTSRPTTFTFYIYYFTFYIFKTPSITKNSTMILYTYGFIAALMSLILWFIFKESKWAGNLFGKTLLLALVAYAAGLMMGEGDMSQKMFLLARDAVIMSVLSVAFSFMNKNKLALVAMVLGVVMFFKFYYFQELQTAFVDKTKVEVDSEGEILIDVADGKSIKVLNHIIQKYDLDYEIAFPKLESPEITDLDDYYVLNIPKKYENQRARIMRELMDSGYADDVEENELVYAIPTIESKKTSNNKIDFGVNDPSVNGQWALEALEMNKLYDLVRSKKIKSEKVARVFVLDTGIDAQHEDISDNYKSIDKRYDMDKMGHGTHCAGTISAVTNNGKGVAAFCPDNSMVQLTSVKVLSNYGGGTQQGIIGGMIKAADKGADVVSMSLGGPSNDSRQRAYTKAVKYMTKKGTITVVAAGNSSRNAKDYVPAGVEGVISVAAINNKIEKAPFSNFVTDVKMGIAAPGVDILSTVPGSAYKEYSGTSMACPHVAGLVGMMRSVNPKLTTAEAYKILHDTGKETKDTKATGRMIYPVDAVKAAAK